MNDDGYTLAEMLIALVVIGLVMGGLMRGLGLTGLMQSETAVRLQDARDLKTIRTKLQALLDGQGPFLAIGSKAGEFSGTPRQFNFECGQASRCVASLQASGSDTRLLTSRRFGPADVSDLSQGGGAEFLYGSDGFVGSRWPPTTDQQQALRWVAVVRESRQGRLPLVSVRIPIEESPTCEFDTITRGCRDATK
jgi:prepilin-type N-terminal cleavage/methylation domain-containing protein